MVSQESIFMYLALDEIAGVVEFPTSLAKFFEAGFDSLPLWEKKTAWERKQGWVEKVYNLLGTMSAQLWVLLLDLGIDSGYIPTHPLY